MQISKMLDSGRCVVFFDFDDTIASCDVFDDMLLHFAVDNSWMGIEKKWQQGKIGSRECMEGQLKCMRTPAGKLNAYLSAIQIDPYFKKLLGFLQKRRIKSFILSDNFDYILNRVLAHRGIRGIKVYSNKARLRGDRLVPSFPFGDTKCRVCAHCKKKNLLSLAGKNPIIIYIGDGRSDTCPAGYADLVFAKAYLLEYCRKKKLAHRPFSALKDVYQYLRSIKNER